jgi:phage terminase large subunit-like protein
MTPLLRALEAARKLAEKAAADPLRWVQWTPPQDALLRLGAPRKLLRAGNQIGKTTAALAEVIWRATGLHPHLPTRAPPIEAWIVCTSWSQSVAIMRKFHALCPADAVDARRSSRFSVRSGYGKDNPAVVLMNGSIVRFRTTRQGAEALQGATVHHVLIDEPTDVDIYRELDRRLLRTGGTLTIAMTPANRDCAWLREMVEHGSVVEVHARLTVENLTPIGESLPLALLDGTLMDAEWIAEQWRTTPAIYAPVVLDGAWEIRPEGVFFVNFDRAKHVSATMRLDPARAPVVWAIGIDYAAAPREYGQTAMLCQVQTTRDVRGRTREAILVTDEVVMAGTASNAQFAAEVVAMLRRHGVEWRDVAHVHGDNPVVSRWVEKSNLETMRAIARELGVGAAALQPRIRNAKEGRMNTAMLDAGCRYLYEHIADGLLIVHPRCSLLIDAIETWDYGRDHPGKDRIDAVRYALKPFIFPRHLSAATVRIA